MESEKYRFTVDNYAEFLAQAHNRSRDQQLSLFDLWKNVPLTREAIVEEFNQIGISQEDRDMANFIVVYPESVSLERARDNVLRRREKDLRI